MTKIDKLLKKFRSNPKDFSWDELTVLLASFGYVIQTGGTSGGSRRKFIHKEKPPIIAHKPHPKNIVKTYLINQIIEQLKMENLL